MSGTTETFYNADQKTWSGPERTDVYTSQATLGGEILKALKENPSKIIQVMDCDGSETTASVLLRNSQLIAAEFLKLGLKDNDVIGLYAYNTKNIAAVIIASLLCGSPWNSLYAEFDKAEIKKLFELTTPKIICCNVENYEILKSALEEMDLETIVYTINGKIPDVLSLEEILLSSKENSVVNSYPGLQLHGDSTAAIMFSSGTTGNPKGVLLSHRSILNNFSKIFCDITAESTVLLHSTLYWISGVFSLLVALLNGCKLIATSHPSLSPHNFLNLIQKHSITHILAPTPLMAQLVKESKTENETRFSSVHCLCYSGSKVPSAITEKLFKLFSINDNKPGPLICYGMTELSGIISQTFRASQNRRYDNEGKLMPNIKVRIVDCETGDLLGPNETGCIFVHSPYQWAGYYKNPEATQKVYQNGWLNTGDVGYFDDNGYLIICARESEIFKSNGFHINPNYLENLILQIPGVAEVCVFGKPDLLAINFIACAVVRSKDDEGAALTEAQLEAYASKHNTKTCQITGGVYFVENLPRSASGKLLRRKIYDFVQKTMN